MITQEQVLGHWNELRGKIKQQWGVVTDDELQEAEGQISHVIGLIQQKTGESRHQIERTLDELNNQCASAAAHATETAREYANQASAAVREATDQARERAQQTYSDAQQLVRRRPAEAIAVAFGTGLVAGVIVGLVVRPR